MVSLCSVSFPLAGVQDVMVKIWAPMPERYWPRFGLRCQRDVGQEWGLMTEKCPDRGPMWVDVFWAILGATLGKGGEPWPGWASCWGLGIALFNCSNYNHGEKNWFYEYSWWILLLA